MIEPNNEHGEWFDLNPMAVNIPLFPLKAHLHAHIAFKPADECIPFPRSLMGEHPLTCVGSHDPKPHRPVRPRATTVNYAIAWQTLCAAIFTEVVILDEQGQMPRPLTLCLSGPTCMVPDMARVFNWRPKDAKKYILSLVECGLVDEQLSVVLISKIGTTREKRQPLSKATRAMVMAKTSGRCVYCGVPLCKDNYHADHLFPVKNGATDDPALLVPACEQCNLKKGAMTLSEFVNVTRSNADHEPEH